MISSSKSGKNLDEGALPSRASESLCQAGNVGLRRKKKEGAGGLIVRQLAGAFVIY